MTTEQRAGTTVRTPAQGESVDEGTITRWLEQPGDHITAEEPLLEVARDKVDTAIPSPVTGFSSRGALFDTPIINQPQTEILGVGAVVARLVPTRQDGELRIDVRPMAYLSISYDHRIADGSDAARFLTAVKTRL